MFSFLGLLRNESPLHGLTDSASTRDVSCRRQYNMRFLREAGRVAVAIRKASKVPIRALFLALTQALLGPRRWNFFQLCIASSHAPLPWIGVLKPIAAPLLCTWVYGLTARVLLPVHRRSLSFWQRVLPIYAGYKRTQIILALRRADSQTRDRVWEARHQWGATRVYNLCVQLRGFYLKDGTSHRLS